MLQRKSIVAASCTSWWVCSTRTRSHGGPQQALAHPFLTQAPFSGTFIPPPRRRHRAQTASTVTTAFAYGHADVGARPPYTHPHPYAAAAAASATPQPAPMAWPAAYRVAASACRAPSRRRRTACPWAVLRDVPAAAPQMAYALPHSPPDAGRAGRTHAATHARAAALRCWAAAPIRRGTPTFMAQPPPHEDPCTRPSSPCHGVRGICRHRSRAWPHCRCHSRDPMARAVCPISGALRAIAAAAARCVATRCTASASSSSGRARSRTRQYMGQGALCRRVAPTDRTRARCWRRWRRRWLGYA